MTKVCRARQTFVGLCAVLGLFNYFVRYLVFHGEHLKRSNTIASVQLKACWASTESFSGAIRFAVMALRVLFGAIGNHKRGVVWDEYFANVLHVTSQAVEAVPAIGTV